MPQQTATTLTAAKWTPGEWRAAIANHARQRYNDGESIAGLAAYFCTSTEKVEEWLRETAQPAAATPAAGEHKIEIEDRMAIASALRSAAKSYAASAETLRTAGAPIGAGYYERERATAIRYAALFDGANVASLRIDE